jgi:hypothetical protein
MIINKMKMVWLLNLLAQKLLKFLFLIGIIQQKQIRNEKNFKKITDNPYTRKILDENKNELKILF